MMMMMTTTTTMIISNLIVMADYKEIVTRLVFDNRFLCSRVLHACREFHLCRIQSSYIPLVS
jgi:hypothetical protein